VNQSDLTPWSANFGMASGADFGDGDNDRDGDVDGDDFLGWQRNLGATAPSMSAAWSVPEPSSLALASIVMLAAGSRRGRRRHLSAA
jgi:hypothetical protein